jgi:hypothetical protein
MGSFGCSEGDCLLFVEGLWLRVEWLNGAGGCGEVGFVGVLRLRAARFAQDDGGCGFGGVGGQAFFGFEVGGG